MNTLFKICRLIGMIYLFYINIQVGLLALFFYSVIFIPAIDKFLSGVYKHILWLLLLANLAYLIDYTKAFLWFYEHEQGKPDSVLFKGPNYVMPNIPESFLDIPKLGSSYTLNYGYQVLAMFFLITLIIRLIRFYILRPANLDSSHWDGVFGFFRQTIKTSNGLFESVIPFIYNVTKYVFVYTILKKIATFMSFSHMGENYPFYSLLTSLRFVIDYPVFSIFVIILILMFVAWLSSLSKTEDPYLKELRLSNELALERLNMYW